MPFSVSNDYCFFSASRGASGYPGDLAGSHRYGFFHLLSSFRQEDPFAYSQEGGEPGGSRSEGGWGWRVECI